uniref:Uncharacterized protein n=1 Tax=Vitis vinifera TaxID=29760 RepID=A5BD57_VITVI|nr:hypothetical protein VITISV_028343 [Vitis vinifera]
MPAQTSVSELGFLGGMMRSRVSSKSYWVILESQTRIRTQKRLTCTCLFGLGVPELVVMAGVAALVFGPKKLPEDFVRDLSKPFSLRLSSRVDTYMASTIQAFDVPWPTIQANAIYFSNSMLSVSDDQHILALYYTWVFGMLKQRLRQ